MNNRPHKKEKPKKRSKKYFVKKVVYFIHGANPIVHYLPPKMTVPDATNAVYTSIRRIVNRKIGQ
jgi:hypothetical protein